ncbi:protein sneaky [Bradysia coprophila]|uniref:protein sneaky n=1 Tax=Bradysia coprophila TaxID=38358 RepID=UPI00187DD170|nr:protein sneaky [Bradysia coprophila]
MLCWPMKLDALCNVLKSGDTEKLCDSSNVIDRDFGDSYVELKSLEQSLQKQKDDKVEIDTNISVNPSAEIKTMKEMNKKFSQEIEDKSKAVSGFIFVIQKILSLVLLRTVFGAYTYYRKYMTNIEFDNRFVTEYFEKIDLRRKDKGLSNLLPLKKIERKTITVSKTSRVKLTELWFMFPFLVKLLFEIIFSSCILIFNHLLYVSLKSVAQHGEITYHQEGELIIETFVNGTGVVAMMVRQFLNNFNVNENVSSAFSNVECLPRPNKLSIWLILKIYGLYCVIIFYKWNLAFAQRLRTNVMAVHFPKREKKRILFLYNECLKNRKRLRQMVKKMLCRKLRNTGSVEENPLRILVNRFPRYFDWLKVLPCARNKCFICNKVESFGRDGRLIDSDAIEGRYCNDCCEEYEDVLEEIRLKYSSGSDSGSSQGTSDSDSTD